LPDPPRGDLEERQIARLVVAGAPIEAWGVGTELGTSRDAPALGGVYKLVADAASDGSGWRPVWKRSPAKATIPGPKQVFRRYDHATMTSDLIAEASERHAGRSLLEPFVASGELIRREPLSALRERALADLSALPARLRHPERGPTTPYPVTYSERLLRLSP